MQLRIGINPNENYAGVCTINRQNNTSVTDNKTFNNEICFGAICKLSPKDSATVYTLKAALLALKCKAISENVTMFANALSHVKNNSSETNILADIPGAIDKCINDIVPKDALNRNPALKKIVTKMRLETLEDISLTLSKFSK